MTKHTPGPWHYSRLPFSFEVTSGDVNDPPRDICRLADDESEHQGVTPEMEANARLIAAAPELFEGCKYSLFALREFEIMPNLQRRLASIIATVIPDE